VLQVVALLEQGRRSGEVSHRPHFHLLQGAGFYEHTLLPALARLAAAWCYSSAAGEGALTQLQQAHFLAYVGSAGESEAPFQAACSAVEALGSPLCRQLAVLSRLWLQQYLPHCLRKVHRVAFGLLSDSAGFTPCDTLVRWNSSAISCNLPPGLGANLVVEVDF
jgi:hypothetical protein